LPRGMRATAAVATAFAEGWDVCKPQKPETIAKSLAIGLWTRATEPLGCFSMLDGGWRELNEGGCRRPDQRSSFMGSAVPAHAACSLRH
jgi:hypothetical protein